MAYTVAASTLFPIDVWGQTEIRFVTLTPAAADYATGGYLLTPGQGISLRSIYFVIPTGGQGGYDPVWNPATGKVQVFQGAAALGPGTEVPAATDLSAYTFTFLLIGN